MAKIQDPKFLKGIIEDSESPLDAKIAAIVFLKNAYTAGLATVPADMQLAALETIALAYKQRDHIDVSSKSLAGETISYITADLTPAARTRLAPFRRVVSLS